MRIQVAGRQVDVGQALTARIEEELTQSVAKYFASRPGDAIVTVGRSGPFFSVDCAVHLDSGINLQAEGTGNDAHAAFSDALERLEKRVRRYKRRLKNHHAQAKAPLPAETATAYVLAAQGDDEAEAAEAPDAGDAHPLVIAETAATLRTMSVSTAVLQLDLAEAPALMFRNAAHGGLNMVYRRADGNVGWVDPTRLNGAKT